MKKALAVLTGLLLTFTVALSQSKAKGTAKPRSTPATEDPSPFRVVGPRVETEWETIAFGELVLWEHNTKNVIRKPGGLVRAWFRRSPNAKGLADQKAQRERIEEVRSTGDSVKGFERWSHTLTHYEFDCFESKIRVLDVIDYDDDGDILLSVRNVTGWRNTIPGTFAETMQETVCFDADPYLVPKKPRR